MSNLYCSTRIEFCIEKVMPHNKVVIKKKWHSYKFKPTTPVEKHTH